MSTDELHATFYARADVSKADLEVAFTEIGRAVGVPAGRLRPTDRFDVELAPLEGWEFDDGLSVLSALAERRLVERGLDKALLTQIDSIDDYVRMIAPSITR